MNLFFSGRHHLLTNFQHDYLSRVLRDGVNGKKITKIIFAINSSNHENTRRNPVPLYLRVLAISRFAADFPCNVKIYPIPDVQYTRRFAEYMLAQIRYQGGERLTPQNTIVAHSTPSIVVMFRKLGFTVLPVELLHAKPETYRTRRPFEVVELLAKAGKRWRADTHWRRYAHRATQAVFEEYNVGDEIVELFRDALLTDDAEITTTRDYDAYAKSMDSIVHVKFNDIQPFVVEGKIVDAGCSTGSLIRLLANAFPESDIIGIEATRKFYEFCRLQEYPNPFVFFYRRNITDQNFQERSINTFIYSSVLHEVYSYLGERTLHRLLRHTFTQLAPGGRIIIRDVVGPEHPHRKVLLRLNQRDGNDRGAISKLSSYARFFRFIRDFRPRRIPYRLRMVNHERFVELAIRDAYEYLSKMTYVESWKSEMCETFGHYSYSTWCSILTSVGFRIAPGSRSFLNPYIIETMYRPRAEVFTQKRKTLVAEPYPPTNMILVAERPSPSHQH